MANDNLDNALLREMYNEVRKAEIKNTKTRKNDDRQMVAAIESYIIKKVNAEVKKHED